MPALLIALLVRQDAVLPVIHSAAGERDDVFNRSVIVGVWIEDLHRLAAPVAVRIALEEAALKLTPRCLSMS